MKPIRRHASGEDCIIEIERLAESILSDLNVHFTIAAQGFLYSTYNDLEKALQDPDELWALTSEYIDVRTAMSIREQVHTFKVLANLRTTLLKKV